MKAKFGREIGLMSLPVLIIAIVVWWQTLEATGNTPLANARRPALSLQDVYARVDSPNRRAESGEDVEGWVVATVIPSINALQAKPKSAPHAVWFDIVDEKGRSLKAILGKKGRVSQLKTYTYMTSGRSWVPATGGGPVADKYEVSWQIPLQYLPKATRSARLKARIGWGNAQPIAVDVEVMPAWMRRRARRLKIQRVAWQPDARGTGGKVVVDVTVEGVKTLSAYGISIAGTGFWDTYPTTNYEPFIIRRAAVPGKAVLGPVAVPGEALLLVAWSERIESGDGKYNSLEALTRWMDMQEQIQNAALAGKTSPAKTSLPVFAPRFKTSIPFAKGNKGRIQYRVNSIPRSIKNPVFRADIFVEGDGKIAISCPLEPSSNHKHL